jgi:hypothetical protein
MRSPARERWENSPRTNQAAERRHRVEMLHFEPWMLRFEAWMLRFERSMLRFEPSRGHYLRAVRLDTQRLTELRFYIPVRDPGTTLLGRSS